jgi:hypothetical protein
MKSTAPRADKVSEGTHRRRKPFMDRKNLAEVVRITDHISRLGLGHDVVEKATVVRHCAQMAKLHPFESSYHKDLDHSLHEFGLLLLEIGYLEPIEPRNPQDLHGM